MTKGAQDQTTWQRKYKGMSTQIKRNARNSLLAARVMSPKTSLNNQNSLRKVNFKSKMNLRKTSLFLSPLVTVRSPSPSWALWAVLLKSKWKPKGFTKREPNSSSWWGPLSLQIKWNKEAPKIQDLSSKCQLRISTINIKLAWISNRTPSKKTQIPNTLHPTSSPCRARPSNPSLRRKNLKSVQTMAVSHSSPQR